MNFLSVSSYLSGHVDYKNACKKWNAISISLREEMFICIYRHHHTSRRHQMYNLPCLLCLCVPVGGEEQVQGVCQCILWGWQGVCCDRERGTFLPVHRGESAYTHKQAFMHSHTNAHTYAHAHTHCMHVHACILTHTFLAKTKCLTAQIENMCTLFLSSAMQTSQALCVWQQR